LVRTGQRGAVLRDALRSDGFAELTEGPPRPRVAELPQSMKDELMELYRRLGGQDGVPTLRPGPWDLVLEGPLVVELDEELHFNRYRALTLSVSWSTDLPWRAPYLGYCGQHEDECLSAGSWGKRWTNPSCERMFGTPDHVGELDGAGAPRWKQRALYDAMKDIAPTIHAGLRMARFSVYDVVGGVRLWDVVAGRAVAAPGAMRSLIEARTTRA